MTLDARIVRTLRRVAGLEVELLGSAAVQSAVARLAARASQVECGSYAQHVERDSEALQTLIEAVVVPETWFFRHPRAFEVLVAAMRRRTAAAPARILCAPCSTGEEAYSIAIALDAAGIGAQRYMIEGYDISAAAVAAARQGRFGANAFRGDGLACRDRYFERKPEGWIVDARLRERLRFGVGNLTSPGFAAGARYDFIFCRNVLIYFSRAMQLAVLRTLHARLADAGMLFVGSAEGAATLAGGFLASSAPQAFAFTKGRPCADASASVSHASKLPSVPQPCAAARTTPGLVRPELPSRGRCPTDSLSGTYMPHAGATAPETSRDEAQAVSCLLDQAAALADSGRLDEASAVLERVLRTARDTARAYCLRGAIAASRDQAARARDDYRRALYLDAHHYETLVLYAAQAEADGDPATARRLRQRAQRIETMRGQA